MVLLRKIKSQLTRSSAFLIAVTSVFLWFQTRQSYGGGKTSFKFNLQWVIWWWQLACLNYQIRLVNEDWIMQEEDWGIIYVGSVITWWSPWDEETDSRSIPSLVQILPSHQEFDLQLKSPNVSLKAVLLKLMSAITLSELDKKISKSSEDCDGER